MRSVDHGAYDSSAKQFHDGLLESLGGSCAGLRSFCIGCLRASSSIDNHSHHFSELRI